jgi:hypothetical protein
MGGSQSGLASHIELDTLRKDLELTQRLVTSAFNKCVEKRGPAGTEVLSEPNLTDEEVRCVNEYAKMYMRFARNVQGQHVKFFTQHQEAMFKKQQAMMEKAGMPMN